MVYKYPKLDEKEIIVFNNLQRKIDRNISKTNKNIKLYISRPGNKI